MFKINIIYGILVLLMTTDTKKIGQLISQIRHQRGLTQSEFAKQLGTSQSAVNRIEQGKQNFSIEMLGRISDVLNKEIVSITAGAINFKVEGGRELSGAVDVKVSKNAAVGLLCASLLNQGTTRLKRMPKIEEVFRIIEVLESIGVSVKWSGSDLEIKPPAKLDLNKIDQIAARKTRSVLMMIGPLIHLFDSFKLPYAGGCKLGTRTVQPHLYGLQAYGVEIEALEEGFYQIDVNKEQPNKIVLYESGDTVTENVLMAAAKTDTTTEIKMASANYMVQEMCFFLQKLGVKIEGIGSTSLKITGLKTIKKNISYSPSEDPIEAMMFLAAAATTNSSITIKRCPIDFLELELLKMEKMGFKYKIAKSYKADNGVTDLVDIQTLKTDGLTALDEKIYARPYPGLNIDNLPFFVPIAAAAHGRTLIHDWVYENRAVYYTELSKLGANVTLADAHRLYIDGPTEFTAAEVVCPPALRPAVIILIAMLAADGTSILRNVYSINRGYEDLAERLNSLGAKVSVLRDI